MGMAKKETICGGLLYCYEKLNPYFIGRLVFLETARTTRNELYLFLSGNVLPQAAHEPPQAFPKTDRLLTYLFKKLNTITRLQRFCFYACGIHRNKKKRFLLVGCAQITKEGQTPFGQIQ